MWKGTECLTFTLPASKKLSQSPSIVTVGKSNINDGGDNVYVITHNSFTICKREKSKILISYILLIYNRIPLSYCPLSMPFTLGNAGRSSILYYLTFLCYTFS
jgi:hypothetical protein